MQPFTLRLKNHRTYDYDPDRKVTEITTNESTNEVLSIEYHEKQTYNGDTIIQMVEIKRTSKMGKN